MVVVVFFFNFFPFCVFLAHFFVCRDFCEFGFGWFFSLFLVLWGII